MDSSPIFGESGARLVRALSDGVLVVDADGRIRYASEQAHRQFGAIPPDLLGVAVDALVPVDARSAHEAQRRSYLHHATTRFGDYRSELVGQRLDGTRFPAVITLAPLDTAEGTMILTLVRARPGPVQIGGGIERDSFAQTLFGLSLQLDAACAHPDRIDSEQVRRIADRLAELVRQFPQMG